MKLLLTAILLAFLTFNAQSQIISNYGLKLGIGISNQSWAYKTDIVNLGWKDKTGVSIRIFADFFKYSFFQLEGELGFIRKGFEDNTPITTEAQPDGTGQFITVNNKLDYLTISPLAKLTFGPEEFSPYIIFGPQASILLNKNVEKYWGTFFADFNESNIGLSAGAGIEIKNILPVSILVEYRYERDLLDNYNKEPYDIKNYSHVILLGVKI